MAINPLIFFLTSLYVFSLSADCVMGAETDTFRPLCSRMCNSSADFRENALFSYKCSCSKSCTVYNDCCYDSPHKEKARSTNSNFACISVVGMGSFRAVARCSHSWRANSCTDYLGHMPPVTSRVTNITYGNVFCASCNDDGDNLIQWNVHLRCPLKTGHREIDLDFNQLKYKSGTFWGRNAGERNWRSCKFYAHYNNFAILKDLELRPCVIPTKVSRCPETWRDLSVEQKCRSYEDPVYINNIPFRNSHCAECNLKNVDRSRCIPSYVQELLNSEMVDEDYIRSCMAVSPYRCVSDMGKGIFYNIRFLFDQPDLPLMEEIERPCLPPAGRLCCRGERYDDNTNRCRRIRSG